MLRKYAKEIFCLSYLLFLYYLIIVNKSQDLFECSKQILFLHWFDLLSLIKISSDPISNNIKNKVNGTLQK